jgi:hypothetical protein
MDVFSRIRGVSFAASAETGEFDPAWRCVMIVGQYQGDAVRQAYRRAPRSFQRRRLAAG